MIWKKKNNLPLPPPKGDIVEVENLYKSYGKTKALNEITFNVEEEELFGFIGPDGGGKTTLFRILASLLKQDKGTAKVAGLDVIEDYKKIRTKIGYMPGRFSLYQYLSVEENLKFFATVFGTTIEKNYNLIKDIYIFLEPFKKRRAGALSGGMKQKLALCCALIHKPEVLILDEPTTGVDPVSRSEFWEMLSRLKEEGITTIVSTPYMDEAVLCDRVALIQKGSLLAIDTPKKITEQFGKKLFAIKSDNMYMLNKIINKYEFADSVNIFGEFIHYTDKREDVKINTIKNYLTDEKISSGEIEIKEIKPGIEDVFMSLMK
ncbi:MAG: ABC transporter ATP-binding protein [Ignavibacteria bacterium]|nr:ABC transporter ATP-binding protein [Ignavibacteria bacterium]